MSIDKKQYDDIVKYLNSSALYHMSLSSMELFHSNFFRWLMEFNIRYVEIFFDELASANKNEVIIKREYDHTDISIDVNGELYIIENKFKSLVRKEQLEGYENDLIDKFKKRKIKSKFKKGKYLFPIKMQKYKDLFSGVNNANWEFLDYETIMDNIERVTNSIFTDLEKATDTNYKIIDEYLKMTRNLIKLTYYVINTHFKDKFIVNDKDVYKNLETIRLHDIMSKINCELLKEKLDERLKNEFKTSYGKIMVKSDYQRGNSYLQARWKLPYDDNDLSKGYFLIGAHLQGDELKTMIHMCAKHLGLEGIKQKSGNIKDKIAFDVYAFIKPYIFNHGETYYSSSKTKLCGRYTGIEDQFEYLSIYKYIKIHDKKNETNFDSICDKFVKILKVFENINKEDLIDVIKNAVEKSNTI